MSFGRGDVEVVEDHTEYAGFFSFRRLKLRHRLYRGGWSDVMRRELLVQPCAVGVLLYDPALDKVALIEQFRVGAMEGEGPPWQLELVAGVIDDGESLEDVARRESDEEAGCAVEALEFIADYYTSPGASTEFFSLFCGRCDLANAGGVHGIAAEHEDIQLRVVDYSEAWRLTEDNGYSNPHLFIAMLWLDRHRERLRREWR